MFKRFYLLASIVVSIIIPFITFTQYVEPVQTLGSFQPPFVENILFPQEVLEQPKTNYLPILLWSIYGLGVLLFTVKFIYNLTGIFNRIYKNPKYKSDVFTNVLLKNLIIPHTFFSYIFLNKQKFETQQIPEEVLIHEQTHAKQKHSLDVIFIEILQILFWFNPLIYLLKYTIKLNHEFLADDAVLKQGIATSNYQHTLLSFSSNDSEPQLAHAINYSSIKKRFTVMKTKTSKQKTWLLSILLLPLLAITLYSFSSVKEVEKENINSTNINPDYTARSIDIEIQEDGTYLVDNLKANKNSLAEVVNQLHQDISYEVRNKIMNIHVSSSNEISKEEVWFIYNSLFNYGFHRLVTDNQEVIKSKGNKPLAIESSTKSNSLVIKIIDNETILINNEKNSNEHLEKRINLFVKKLSSIEKEKLTPIIIYNSPDGDETLLQIKSILRKHNLLHINTSKKHIEIKDKDYIETTNENKTFQQSATKAQIAEYNKLAKKYNTMTNGNFTVKNKEVKRLNYIYRIMTVEQRKNAEPFPVFPPPPPVPDTPKLKIAPPPPPIPADAIPEQKKKYKKVIEEYNQKNKKAKTGFIDVNGKKLYYTQINNKVKYYNRFGVETDKEGKEIHPGKQVNANDVLPNSTITRVYHDDKVVSEFKKTNSNYGDIPPPPPPVSPLDHVIAMAKKGATFYYEEKEISSDKAIQLLKKNKELNISTKTKNGVSVVKIQTEPINH